MMRSIFFLLYLKKFNFLVPILTYRPLSYSLLLLLILISVGLLYAYFESRWQPTQYPVVIAVSKTPLSTPFYVARAIGAFDDTCVSVEFDEVVGGQRAFVKMMNGEVDFATSSDSVMAFRLLENKEFVTHAMFVQSDNDVKLISRASANINSTLDLKGKGVAVIKGTASEYFLSTLLALEGLTTEDVVLHYFRPEELMNAFISNEVDAFVPWEPFGFHSDKALNQQIKIHNTKSLHTLSFNLLSGTADNLQVEKAKCIIQGLSKAIDYIASNPSVAKEIVRSELKFSAELIDWVWADYIFKLGLNQSLILSIKSQAIWAVATQMSEYEDVPRIEHFIDSRAMLQALPNAVNIPQ